MKRPDLCRPGREGVPKFAVESLPARRLGCMKGRQFCRPLAYLVVVAFLLLARADRRELHRL